MQTLAYHEAARQLLTKASRSYPQATPGRHRKKAGEQQHR